MKNIILGIGTFIVVLGTITAINASSTNNSNGCGASCTNEECHMCPCTPDCQPGDEHCVCPAGCKN